MTPENYLLIKLSIEPLEMLGICTNVWIILFYKRIQYRNHEGRELSTTDTWHITTRSFRFTYYLLKNITSLAIHKSMRIVETLDFRVVNCACVHAYGIIKITICSSQSADKILKSLMQFFPVWWTRRDSDQLRQ